jgi:hypothetical protein
MQTGSSWPIPLGVVVRSTALIFALLGFGFGLIVLIGTLLGIGDAFFQFGMGRVSGVLAALVGVPVMVVLFGLGGSLFGIILYLPLNWLLQANRR